MTYLVGVALFSVGFVLIIGPPGIRKFFFVAATIFGLTFSYFVDKSNKDSEAFRIASLAKETDAAMRIKPEEVQLDSANSISISFGAYELMGVVTNNSKYPLSGISLRIALTDCVTSDSCSIVGERDAFVHLAVPPGETRPFQGTPIAFINLPLLLPQKRSASVELIGTRADNER
jgi:hypothetical protein